MKAGTPPLSFTDTSGPEDDRFDPDERVKISCCIRIAAGRTRRPPGAFGLESTASAPPKKPKEPIRIYEGSVCSTT
ncbi:hypothetical protein SRM_01117 [Salinibacter ruber M8]|uniref:Uncharacterized protein n=1 Tax=Salinibacter ruber (strain M8) TaxID=761659 RepID=D5H7N3_SALRM|nr:hypothetical protein SRM_01117 [Salinibacter ruber M8]